MRHIIKKHLSVLSGLVLLGLFGLNSCDYSYFDMDEIPDYTYSPTFAIPIAKAVFSVNDFIIPADNEELYTDGQGRVVMVYKGMAHTPVATEIFRMADLEINRSISIPGPGSNYQTFTGLGIMSFGGFERLDSAYLKAGSLQLSVSAPGLVADGYGALVIVSIPESQGADGEPISASFPLGGSATIDLSGADIHFYGHDGRYNLFNFQYEVLVTGSGNPAGAPWEMTFNHQFSSIEYTHLFGYFAWPKFAFETNEFNLGFFENSLGGKLFFEDPELKFRVNNSFGLPLMSTFSEFYFSGPDGDEQLTGFPQGMMLNFPPLTDVGGSAQTEYVMNRQNSNLKSLLDKQPGLFTFKLEVEGDSHASNHYFVTEDSRADMEVELHLPFRGMSENYIVRDTSPIDCGDCIHEKVEWIEFNFDLLNHFPLDMYMQLSFFDENGQFLMDMIQGTDELVAEAAPVNSNGVVTEPRRTVTKVMLPRERAQMLVDARSVEIKARLMSVNDAQTIVNIFSDYTLEVAIGARIKGEVVVEL